MSFPRLPHCLATAILLSTIGIVPIAQGAPRAESGAVNVAAGSEAASREVVSWYVSKSVGLSPELALAAAGKFLEDLRSTKPSAYERLAESAEADLNEHAPALWRHLAAVANKPEFATKRTEWAKSRLVALIEENEGRQAKSEEIDALLASIKNTAEVYHRRLLEGKMEDADLWALVRKTKEPKAAPKVQVAKDQTASELMSEYLRKNQEGSAMSRIRAYTAEFELSTAAGAKQRLIVSRMRPDYFRLQVYDGDTLNLILAGGDGQYWQWARGGRPAGIKPEAVTSREFLNRFLDPLVQLEGTTTARLADEVQGERKLRRLQIVREESRSTFVFDAETGELVRRENGDGSKVLYSEHKFVSGVRLAFKEETTDAQGRKGVLTLKRVVMNPLLFSAFFLPPRGGPLDLFTLQREWSGALKAAK